SFIPPLAQLFTLSPWWKNPFENVMTVQFDHRMAAYAIFALAALHAWKTRTAARSIRFHASRLFGLIVLQVALGIATLLFVAPFTLALLHQLGAVIVLGAATRHVALLARS